MEFCFWAKGSKGIYGKKDEVLERYLGERVMREGK